MMKQIEFHRYLTPMQGNRDAPFSVGLLNLTEQEARLVNEFVAQLQTGRNNAERWSRRLDGDKGIDGTLSPRQRTAGSETVTLNGYLRPDENALVALTQFREDQQRTRDRLLMERGVVITREEAAALGVELDAVPAAEPAPVGNRFSGLDLDGEKP